MALSWFSQIFTCIALFALTERVNGKSVRYVSYKTQRASKAIQFKGCFWLFLVDKKKNEAKKVQRLEH